MAKQEKTTATSNAANEPIKGSLFWIWIVVLALAGLLMLWKVMGH